MQSRTVTVEVTRYRQSTEKATVAISIPLAVTDENIAAYLSMINMDFVGEDEWHLYREDVTKILYETVSSAKETTE